MFDNFESASLGKRYMTGIVDLLMVFVLTLLTYLVLGFPLGKKACSFDENVLYQKKLTLEIYDHMYETGLYIEGEDGPVGSQVLYNKYAKALLNNKEKDEEGKYYSLLANYYIAYSSLLNVDEFNTSILEVNKEDSLFYVKSQGEVGILKPEISKNLLDYFDDVYNDASKEANDRVSYHFQKYWYQAIEKEKQSEFMVDIVSKFNDSLYVQGLGIGLPAIIIYSFYMLVFYLVIPLVFKGNTLGNKLIRTKELTTSNEKISAIRTVVKFVLKLVLYLFIAFVCIAFVTGLENACKVTLLRFNNFNLSLATISFTFILLSVINLFILSLNKRHQSYFDLITGTYCTDLVNKEKEEEKNVNSKVSKCK